MDRAKKFYESVFQTKLEKLDTHEFEMWSFPMDKTTMGCGGSLVKMPGFQSGGKSTIVYFACADCSVEEALAAKNGGSIQKNKVSIGQYGYISLVLDTEGNIIGLHSLE